MIVGGEVVAAVARTRARVGSTIHGRETLELEAVALLLLLLLLLGAQQLADVAGDELRVLAAAVDAPPHHPGAVQPVRPLPVLRIAPRRHPVVTDQPVLALKIEKRNAHHHACIN